MLGPPAAQSYHGQRAALLFPLLWNIKSRDGEAARTSLPGPQRAGAPGPGKGGFWKHLSLGHVALPVPQSTETWCQGYAGEVGEGCWARRLKA